VRDAKASSATSSTGLVARRAHRLWIAVGVVALGSLALAAGPASAALKHPSVLNKFGAQATDQADIGNPRSLAFDQANNRLYAYGYTDQKIWGFDVPASGVHTVADLSPIFTVSYFPPQNSGLSEPTDLTVDQTTGTVYFLDQHFGLFAYDPGDPTATPIFNIPASELNDPCGVAVDSFGTVWVAEKGTQTVNGFTPAGVPLATPAIDVSPTMIPPLPGKNPGCSIAFDLATDDLFVSDSQKTPNLFRYTAASGYTSFSPFAVPSTEVGQMAIDQTRGILYTPGSNFKVDAYDIATGALLERAGPGDHPYFGVAVDEATNDLYTTAISGSNGQSGEVFDLPAVDLPDAGTKAASNITRTSATLNARMDPASGGDITACHFDYGTDTSYALGTLPCTPGPNYLSPQNVSADTPTNLTPDTIYHYRVVGTNGGGTLTGPDLTFRTKTTVFDVSTDAATDVQQLSATLNGSYTGDGPDTQYYFEYGTDNSYGQTSATPPGTDNGTDTGPQNLTFDLTGLHTNTTYHYRFVAHNSIGYTYGADRAFVTAFPDLPTISATSSSSVTQSGATLSAEINPGLGPTVYRFQYGTSDSYGSRTYPGDPLPDDAVSHPVSSDISGLSSGTTYHYRVIATNFAGNAYGPDQTFTTPASPLVGSPDATAITQTTAMLGAMVNPSLSPTTYHFAYGSSDSYGLSTPESGSVGADSSPHPAAAAISGLSPGTTYHFRIVATNAIGNASTPDQTFTTAPAPVVKPTPCKAGFVKRHGKCVKRHKRRHRRHHQRSPRHG
jgi:hypothetical protein